MHRRTLGFLLLFALLLLPTAAAHAALEGATPGPDQNAPAGIVSVELRFTENVERRYTDADVVDLNATSHRSGPIQFSSTEGNVIRVPVNALPDGIYTVTWRTLSVDTHTASGSYLFSVGNATLRPSASTNVHAHGGEEHATNEGVTRAVFYAGLFIAVGVALFALTVDRASMPSSALVRAASALGVTGGAAGLIAITYLMSRTSLSWDDALGTQAGRALFVRATLLLLASIALLLASWGPPVRRKVNLAVGIALGIGAIFATASGSHAAALQSQRGIAVLADTVHLAAGATWVGGIASFVLVGRARSTTELAEMVRRFSRWAMLSVALVIVTGGFAAYLHMSSLDQLWTDPYGRLVAFKSLLLLPLIAIGAYNQRALAPRLVKGLSARRFFRMVEIEALVMVGILTIAGVLSTTPPPPSADLAAGGPMVFELDAFMDKTHVVLLISPGPPTVGVQNIQVQLHPLSMEPIPNSTVVAMKFAAPGEREPDTLVDLTKISPADWRLDGGYLTSVGTWKVYVLVQRPDEFKKLVFEVPVGAPGTNSR